MRLGARPGYRLQLCDPAHHRRSVDARGDFNAESLLPQPDWEDLLCQHGITARSSCPAHAFAGKRRQAATEPLAACRRRSL
jgi:hypothetical protein